MHIVPLVRSLIMLNSADTNIFIRSQSIFFLLRHLNQ